MIARRQWESLGEVFLCSGFPTQLALTGAAGLAGLAPQTTDGGLSLRFVAAVSLADTVALVGLVWWLLRRRGESPAALFLGTRPPGREAALGLALAPAVVLFISATMLTIRAVAPTLHNVPVNPLDALAISPGRAIVLGVVAVLAGGVREELQRAFLIHRFRTDLGGAGTGLLITSIGFGLGHVLQGWDAAIVTALLGAFWGALFLTRGSIAAGVVSHGLANAAQVVVSFVARSA